MDIKERIQESIQVKETILKDESFHDNLDDLIKVCVKALTSGRKILFCGNGGSAADAQHIAAELSGRFYLDREPLNAEALHVNTSYITAVANDYDYNEVFARAVRAKGKSGDILISISTSGNSLNIIKAMEEAAHLSLINVAWTGETGGKMKELSDILINVPSNNTPRIQEAHIMIGHLICEAIEEEIFG